MPSTRAERRRWDAEDRADAARALTIRPNEPPAPSRYTNCHDSVYLTHRFVGPNRRCDFCGQLETTCLRATAPGGG